MLKNSEVKNLKAQHEPKEPKEGAQPFPKCHTKAMSKAM
jgi:hypothetical protein